MFVVSVICLCLPICPFHSFDANIAFAASGKTPTQEASILMYHRIDDIQGCEPKAIAKLNPYPFEVPSPCVTPKRFEQQLKAMKASGCNFLTLTELHERWKKGLPTSRKTVVVTFDDGYSDNFRNAYPIMKVLGIPGTLFLVTDKVDTTNAYLTKKQIRKVQGDQIISPDYNPYIPNELLEQLVAYGQVVKRTAISRFISWTQVIALHEAGWDIQSHTVSHERLTKTWRLEKELADSKRIIQEKLGKTVQYLAYPYGATDANVIKQAKAAGYESALLATKTGFARNTDARFQLKRIAMLESSGDPTVPAVTKPTMARTKSTSKPHIAGKVSTISASRKASKPTVTPTPGSAKKR